MNWKNNNWVIGEALTDPRDREKLFILLESAGFNVFFMTRGHINCVEFPFISFEEGIISGSRTNNEEYSHGRRREVVTYNEAIEVIKTLINEREITWPTG